MAAQAKHHRNARPRPRTPTSSPDRWKRMSLVVMPTVTSFTVKTAGLDMQKTRRASPSLSGGAQKKKTHKQAVLFVR